MHIVLATKCTTLREDECIIVNLTASVGGAESMTFHEGDHPYITKASDVNFGDAEISTLQKVADLANETQPPLSDFDPLKLYHIGNRCKTHSAVIKKIRTALQTKFLVCPQPKKD